MILAYVFIVLVAGAVYAALYRLGRCWRIAISVAVFLILGAVLTILISRVSDTPEPGDKAYVPAVASPAKASHE